MQAMAVKSIGHPLDWTELPDRRPGSGKIRVKVAACGVYRADLHVVDGALPHPRVPIIPKHEIVCRNNAISLAVDALTGLTLGQRVGIPWLCHASGVCPFCKMHHENLCNHPLFSG